MDVLSKIKQAGFDVALVDGFIEITPASELTQSQLAFLKSHKAEIINELQAEALAVIDAPDNQTFVSCGKCLGFKSHNAHGKGSGRCLNGGNYGLWSETLRPCEKFDARVDIQDYVIKEGAEIVTCYTPNGQAFEVEAKDTEHAIWLQKMNPKP